MDTVGASAVGASTVETSTVETSTVDADAVYGALLDAAVQKKHRCIATILGGTIAHRS